MSKGNLFLGFGRGKVGDVVFSRLDGEQVARARNRAPRNPQSSLQLLQRVVMKTTSQAYSFFQAIADHSFQGYTPGTPNQSEFNKRNVERFRIRLASLINSGSASLIDSSEETNFAAKFTSGCEINSYILSDGRLPVIQCEWMDGPTDFGFAFSGSTGSALSSTDPTYQDICNLFGLQRGDQVTFCFCSTNDTVSNPDMGLFNGFSFARVILEPASGDMTTSFLSGTAVNSPNERNEGTVNFSVVGAESFSLLALGSDMQKTQNKVRSVAAACCIASRLGSSGTWLRSPQSLVLRPSTGEGAHKLARNHSVDLLGDAIASFRSGDASTLYLNQSE